MKKIVTFICAIGAAIGLHAAAFNEASAKVLENKLHNVATAVVQGYGTADELILAEGEKFLAETEFTSDIGKRRYMQIFRHVSFIKNPKLSFADWKTACDAKIAELKFEKALDTNDYMVMLLPWYAEHCFKEGYEALVAKEDWKTFVDATFWCVKNAKYQEAWEAFLVRKTQVRQIIPVCMVNLQDPDKAYEAALSLATSDGETNVSSINASLDVIQKYMVNSGKFSDEKMKSLFQQLNRKYSGKLLDDETAWTPVVKRIRTMLGTY